MDKKVKLIIDEDLWQRVKAKASLNYKSIKEFVSEVLEREVSDLETENKKH